jgi:hypothetical protein
MLVSGSRTTGGVVSGDGIGTQDFQQRLGPGVIGRSGSMVAEQDTAISVNNEDPG